MMNSLDRALLHHKDRLARRSRLLLRTVRAWQEDPTRAAEAAELGSLTAPFARSFAAMQDRETRRRRRTIAQKQQRREREEQLARTALENRVLRGEQLTIDDLRPAPAPPRPRRKAGSARDPPAAPAHPAGP